MILRGIQGYLIHKLRFEHLKIDETSKENQERAAIVWQLFVSGNRNDDGELMLENEDSTKENIL